MKHHRVSLLRKGALFLSLLSIPLIFCPIPAQEVLIADKEWRQLTETINFSYNDLVMNGICNASTGVCSGTLRGVDFTGWTWATVDEVGAMFSALGIGPPHLFDTPVLYYEENSAWAPPAIDTDGSGPDTGLFNATWIGPSSADVHGITRTLSSRYNGYVYVPTLVDWAPNTNPDCALTARDYASTTETRRVDDGVWLYRTTSLPDIDVSPVSYNFGNVQWGKASTAMFTITNKGGGQLTLSAISLSDASGAFSIKLPTPLPPLAANQSITVEAAFNPKAIQTYTGAFLTITSNDSDESSINIPLSGTGVLADTPSEQVTAIVDYIQKAIANGELTGVGEGESAAHKVQALINMIQSAGDLLAGGQTVQGCQQLADLYLKVDSVSPPPDFVTGPATAGLASAIQGMRTYYGCQ